VLHRQAAALSMVAELIALLFENMLFHAIENSFKAETKNIKKRRFRIVK
jgi:hypothetical protein